MQIDFTRFKPAVSKHWLILLAGAMWSAVGLMLCRLAVIWLTVLRPVWGVACGLAGFLLAWIIERRFFSALAFKNIDRLCRLADKSCVFGFQAWKSYILIGAMIFLGITLRHSALPKPYLAFGYMTMGVTLFLSSLHFFARFWQIARGKQPGRPPDDGDESGK